MCDELGDEKYMEEYVMEAGGVHGCAVTDNEGCSEKEVKYLTKWRDVKTAEDRTAQLTRLRGMTAGKMKPELMKWIKQRVGILEQLTEADAAPSHEEL